MTNGVRNTTEAETAASGEVDRRWLVLAVVLVAECMDLIDSTVVNVAAPQIAERFHASTTSLQWIVGGYPLAIAVGLIAGGRLGDLVGRRRMFLLGTTGFVVASALCGLSPDAGFLIAARLVQGLFSAMMLPQGFGILRQSFPPEDQQKAFALFGPVIGSSAVLGPIVGGSLIDWNLWGSGWRLVFFVNVPLGLIAIAVGLRLLPANTTDRTARLDLVGTAMVAAFSFLIVYPLIQGRVAGWPWWTFASMGAGVAVLAGFGLQQRSRNRTGGSVLVLASTFSRRGYPAGLAFAVVFFAGMGGVFLCMTLFLQLGQGFTPIRAALCTVPLSIGVIIGSALSGALLGPKFGRKTLQGGVVAGSVGWLLVLIAVHGRGRVGFMDLMPGLLLAGIGLGLIVAPLFDIILAAVEDRESGSASGVLNAGQQLATSVGVAAIGTVFFDSLGKGDFHRALSHSLAIQVASGIALLALSALLPRFARH